MYRFSFCSLSILYEHYINKFFVPYNINLYKYPCTDNEAIQFGDLNESKNRNGRDPVKTDGEFDDYHKTLKKDEKYYKSQSKSLFIQS